MPNRNAVIVVVLCMGLSSLACGLGGQGLSNDQALSIVSAKQQVMQAQGLIYVENVTVDRIAECDLSNNTKAELGIDRAWMVTWSGNIGGMPNEERGFTSLITQTSGQFEFVDVNGRCP